MGGNTTEINRTTGQAYQPVFSLEQVDELAESLSCCLEIPALALAQAELGSSVFSQARRPSKKAVSFGGWPEIRMIPSREEVLSNAEGELWWKDSDYNSFRQRERVNREQKRSQEHQQTQVEVNLKRRVGHSPPPGFPPKTENMMFSFFSNFSEQLQLQCAIQATQHHPAHQADYLEQDFFNDDGGHTNSVNFGLPPLVPSMGIFVQTAA
mmetsp:Transcript_15798/g.25750  ORF Transcript_15798/g.25750 Transcript_15798/m.25750 type:complete len:210 (-) Transcript_15798:119-748(-)